MLKEIQLKIDKKWSSTVKINPFLFILILRTMSEYYISIVE